MLERRDGDAGDAPGADDQQLARVAQVAGQEDDDRDLGELGGLEGQRPEADAEVGAVDLRADPGQARQQQHPDPDRGDGVAVALQHAVVAQQDDRGGEEPQPDDEPLRLLAGQLLVDAVDHHQAEAGQDGEEREQVGVGVGQREAQHHVRRQAQAEEDRPVGQRDVVDDVVALDEDGREARRQQQRRRHERQQLAVARTGHRAASSPVSSCVTRSCASSLERSACSVTVLLLGRRELVDRHAGLVVDGVQVQARRKVVGQSTVDRDEPVVAGAHEVDGLRGVVGREDHAGDEEEDEDRADRDARPAAPAARRGATASGARLLARHGRGDRGRRGRRGRRRGLGLARHRAVLGGLLAAGPRLRRPPPGGRGRR